MTAFRRLARHILRNRLARLSDGHIILVEGGDRRTLGTAATSVHAEIHVHDSRFYPAVVFGGHLGAAEAYMQGWWTAARLTDVVRVFLRNRETLDALETGWARLAQPARKLWHVLNHNTKRGSRRNIAAHYDLGNDFFASILDDTMTYSCGIFESPHTSLREAATAKYDRICQELDLAPHHHVLEIGTGWGGFAIHAASRYGCRVTTTTISCAQAAFAGDRVAAAGLNDRVTVLERDYRDLTGRFDKLVSIEMIEAVGHQHFQTFFQQCAKLLHSHGSMALQAITIDHRYYESARDEVDFIKRYIFPGSCIPSVPILRASAGGTDLSLRKTDEIGPHYAETLRRWRNNLNDNWSQIRALGFTETFRKLWEFYFCYCEGGFRERVLGDVQMIFDKPRIKLAQPRCRATTGRAVVA